MNAFILSEILIGFSSLFVGAFIFIKNPKNRINQLWGIFTISVAIWGFGGWKIALVQSSIQALFWWRITYIGIIFIPALFYHFVYIFLELKKKIILYLIYLLGFFFLFLMWTPWAYLFFGLDNITFIFNSFYWVYPPTYLFTFFALSWISIIVYAHYKLYKASKKFSGLKHDQIKYFFIATATGFLGGSISFLPCFGLNIYPYSNFLVPLYPIIMSYAIVKYKLLNIKIFTAHILIAVLNLIAFSYIFISKTFEEYIIKFLFFLGVLFTSYLLNKYFSKEIEQKRKLNQLARKLRSNNERLQMMADRLAISNDKLRELDNAKSEFLSIASHQLRTPLTIIKGFVSLLLEGSYGKISAEVRETLTKIYSSNERLIKLVEDLLNISRIESGRIKYDIGKIQLENLCKEIVDGFTLQAKEKHLKIEIKLPKKPLPEVLTDEKKIREVISNLVDNAIKYTPKGWVKVSLLQVDDKIQVRVSDTGIGIPADQIHYLFAKFSRGKDINRINTGGTGLGLYVGKKMIESLQGRIWVESKGENQGSTFIIEIPIKLDKQALKS